MGRGGHRRRHRRRRLEHRRRGHFPRAGVQRRRPLPALAGQPDPQLQRQHDRPLCQAMERLRLRRGCRRRRQLPRDRRRHRRPLDPGPGRGPRRQPLRRLGGHVLGRRSDLCPWQYVQPSTPPNPSITSTTPAPRATPSAPRRAPRATTACRRPRPKTRSRTSPLVSLPAMSSTSMPATTAASR